MLGAPCERTVGEGGRDVEQRSVETAGVGRRDETQPLELGDVRPAGSNVVLGQGRSISRDPDSARAASAAGDWKRPSHSGAWRVDAFT